MIYTLKNEVITIQVKSLGAELISLKKNDTEQEFMWEADPAHWGKCSPVLFPFVGGIVNGEYHFEGQTYPAQRHGFARTMQFALASQNESTLVFTLTANEETKAIYPFDFQLDIIYRLCGKTVIMEHQVVNHGEKVMYFSVGAHPAFACPLTKGGKRTDCFIRFGSLQEIESRVVTKSGLIGDERIKYSLENGLFGIEEKTFENDAIILENRQTQEIALCNEEKKVYITVRFDTPLVGVWSMPQTDASFVCIEPWNGRADEEGFTGELPEREWGNKLEPNEKFVSKIEIEI